MMERERGGETGRERARERASERVSERAREQVSDRMRVLEYPRTRTEARAVRDVV